MSQRNSPEAKHERKFWRMLHRANTEYNSEQYREIDGKLYPFKRAPWDIVASYMAGLIDARIEGKDIVIRPSIYRLIDAVNATKDTKIIVKSKQPEARRI